MTYLKGLRQESLNLIVIKYDLLLADDWINISTDAKDLITKMLTMNPANRIAAEQALSDPWI